MVGHWKQMEGIQSDAHGILESERRYVKGVPPGYSLWHLTLHAPVRDIIENVLST